MILPQFFDNPLHINLSFHKIIERLENMAAIGEGVYGVSINELLYEVSLHPELKDGITDVAQLKDNEKLISQLLTELFPVALTLNEIKAVTIPYQGLIFNYSERFRNVLRAAGTSFEINIRDFDQHQFYVASCCLILNQFYGTRIDFNKPLFYDIPTADGIIKHYRIFYNGDFLDIIPAREAPKLNENDIKLLLDNYDNLALWKEKFPPGSWILKGFAIMTLFDVTVESAVSILKSNLLGSRAAPGLRESLETIFRSIFKVNDIEIGFTSYDELRGKLSNTSFGKSIKSFLLPEKGEADFSNVICETSLKALVKERNYFAISDINDFMAKYPDSNVGKKFLAQKVKSFILAPVIKDKVFLGFLELASHRTGEFNSVNANKLDVVMPFIVDSIDRKINEFQNKVEAVIQNNYTTLHSSVNWKFEREAKNYIQNVDAGLDYNLKEISFKRVFPLYGQVDIQNSSITRNLAVKNDLNNQLSQLISIFEQLHDSKLIDNAEQDLINLNALVNDLSLGIRADTETRIQHYLETDIYPLIKQSSTFSEELANDINYYFEQTDRLAGDFFTNRHNYERTLSLVNDKLVDIIDKRQTEIQQYYPHYYERFKTDGVEHNLYIGKAISPDRDFEYHVLKRLRLWQLLVIAEMEMEQYRMKGILPYHLGVTTLILVFSMPIDIRFRMDEKHFDIDGAYNIRYEVIKKRIDKAHIANTDERITRQGKITIVYSKAEEEAEYEEYISLLQAVGILKYNVEKFDVEELQGVLGLKALRVGIEYEENLLLKYSSFYDELYRQLNLSTDQLVKTDTQ